MMVITGPRCVVHFTDTTAVGGAERMLLTLIAGLDRRRWTPVLFHRRSSGIAPLVTEARAMDVRTEAVSPVSGWGDALALGRLVHRLRHERAVVFHAHLTWPLRCRYELIAARLAGIPAVIATQQLYRLTERFRSHVAVCWQRLFCRHLDRYIVVSRAMARDLEPTCGSELPRVEVIYNAVPLERYAQPRAGSLRQELPQAGGRPLVLTLARLDPQKGLSDLLEAAVLVPEALFVIAGTGGQRATLETRSRELGLGERVVFLGYREDIPDLLAACDLLVLPSHFEGLPVSVLEAMAAARPVVATRVGGTDEAVVHGETGLLVPPRDPRALAQSIRALLADRDLARRFGEAGRVRVHKEFSAAHMVQRVSQVYDEVLDRRGVQYAGG
jgi:glycosyltransferase involved in cell wall biosynthesis